MYYNKLALLLALISSSALAYDVLPDVNYKQPIYARENALFCQTKEQFLIASNAQQRGWRYTPVAGIKPPRNIKPGASVNPADFGCKEHIDGRPLVFIGDQFIFIETTDGLTTRQMIRN
jgi:hypothetical protein